MYIGFSKFKRDLSDFVERIPRGGISLVREEGKKLFKEIVDLTPKDTGFASSNWRYKINEKPSGSEIKNPRTNSSYSPAPTPSLQNFKPDSTLYIYNLVAYIRKLEDGWSKKAPANFVKNAVARAKYRLQRGFDKLK